MTPRFRALFFFPILLTLLVFQKSRPGEVERAELLLPSSTAVQPFPGTIDGGMVFETLPVSLVFPGPTPPSNEDLPPVPAVQLDQEHTSAAPEAELSTVAIEQEQAGQEVRVSPEETALQHGVFIELWGAVNENYLYPDFGGLDWSLARLDIQQQIDAGLSMENFYSLMESLVWSLGDDHSSFLPPEKAALEDAKYAGSQGFAGVGVVLSPVPERKRAVVLMALPGGPADEGGITARDSILSVDGQPVIDDNGRMRSLLRGPEGSQVSVEVQSPGQPSRLVTLTRRQVAGSLPVPSALLTTPGGKKVGYILLITFADSTVPGKLEQALVELEAEGPLDGLILDSRFNEGGADTVLKSTLSYFTNGLLGHFTGRRMEKPLEVAGVDVAGSQSLPLVGLLSPRTASFGEIFSGVLRDLGRAILIGETSRGNVETLRGFNFEDGSRAWIAYSSFRPLNNPQDNWELTGVPADRVILSNWDEHDFESDPGVLAAMNYFDSLGEQAFQP